MDGLDGLEPSGIPVGVGVDTALPDGTPDKIRTCIHRFVTSCSIR